MKVTVDEYANQQSISISTARKRLNEMVEAGAATVSHGVIIDHRSMKRGARNQNVAIRGNQYQIQNEGDL